MNYSFDEFFNEEILPKLQDLINGKLSGEMDDSDKFLAILNGAFGFGSHSKESFIYPMIHAMVNPHQEDMSTEQMIRKLFDIMESNSNRLLRKIEYSDGSTVIKVDYNGLEEEHE